MRENQSKLVIRYIKYGIELQSAYWGAEKQIMKYRVDGGFHAFCLEKLGVEYGVGMKPSILEIHSRSI